MTHLSQSEGAVVVVGAGQAGSQAALSLRDEGYDGRIVLIGSETHLPYQRPPLSKKMGHGQRDAAILRAVDAYRAAGIELMLGSAVDRLDLAARQVVLTDGRRVPYRRSILATGARARAWPDASADAHLHYLRGLDDNERLSATLASARSVAIIGGGFIGLELAAAARSHFPVDVVVIESGPNILGRAVTDGTASFVRGHVEAMGIEVLTSAKVASLEGPREGRTSVRLDHGLHLDADLVVSAIGAVPNVAVAERSGLHCDNGIVVDEHLKASRDVYAVGDCGSFPHHSGSRLRLESVQNAIDQARYVARHLTGRTTEPFVGFNWFWSDIGDMKLQIAGLRRGAEQVVAFDEPVGSKRSAFLFDEGSRLVSVETVNRPADHMAAKRALARPDGVSRQQLTDAGWQLRQI